MQTQDNEFARLEAYQEQLRAVQKHQNTLRNLRQQIKRVETRLQYLQKGRDAQLKDKESAIKKAIKSKDYKAVRTLTKEYRAMAKEAKVFDKLAKTSYRLVQATTKSAELNKAIENTLERMAMREARATNAFTQQFAQFRNRFDRVKVEALKIRATIHGYEQRSAIDDHNRAVRKEPFKSMTKDKDLMTRVKEMQEQGKKNMEALKEQPKEKEKEKEQSQGLEIKSKGLER